MKSIDIINANTDLGVSVNGACLGPDTLTENLENEKINCIKRIYADEEDKEFEKDNKKKNLKKLNKFNEQVYNEVLKTIDDGNFPLTIGGDHSLVIASALASINRNKSLGIIWIDAHGDFNTFDTTITGNIHGLPLAAITGYEKKELVYFHNGNHYKYENTVIVGGRDIDPLEIENIKDAGVTVFTTEDIKKNGMDKIMDEAIKIACNGTLGVHISYDLDVIDPKDAPGVSIREKFGISKETAFDIIDFLLEE